MARQTIFFGWITAVWLIAACSLPARAQADAQPSSQTYTSPYRTGSFNTGYSTGGYQTSRLQSGFATRQMQPAGKGYMPAYKKISVYDTDLGTGAKSSSFFHSVSADERLSEYTSEYGGTLNAPRRTRSTFTWDEPEDNPIGTVTNPVPAGEPPILLLIALLGAAYVYRRRRNYSSEK